MLSRVPVSMPLLCSVVLAALPSALLLLPWLCTLHLHPHPGPRPWVPPPAAASQPAKRGTPSANPETQTPGRDSYPPLSYMPGPDTTSKNSFISLLFSAGSRIEITPPAFIFPKNFQTKNPAWVAGGVGAAGDSSGGPLAAWQGYPCPSFPWVPPLRGVVGL
jgi:hypothetical protein